MVGEVEVELVLVLVVIVVVMAMVMVVVVVIVVVVVPWSNICRDDPDVAIFWLIDGGSLDKMRQIKYSLHKHSWKSDQLLIVCLNDIFCYQSDEADEVIIAIKYGKAWILYVMYYVTNLSVRFWPFWQII